MNKKMNMIKMSHQKKKSLIDTDDTIQDKKNKNNTPNDKQEDSSTTWDNQANKQVEKSIICCMQEHYKALLGITGIAVGIALYVWSYDNDHQESDEN